jgi:hypothetical protein
MSEYMISAHGGGKVARTERAGGIATGMIITDTTYNSPAPVHMKQLDYLVSNTTGVARNSFVLDGVLSDTTMGSPTGHMATSEVMKSHEKFATQPGRMSFGQVPYAEAPHSGKPKVIGKEEGTKKGMERKTARKAYEKGSQ